MTTTGRGVPVRIGIERARERIEALRYLNAFISVTEEVGDGPTIAVEDVIDVAGTVTTCGSALPRPSAARDARIVDRIRTQGGVIVGKTNLQPWAFGVTSANPHWGDVRNPADPERIPGGSSGGSAAAVAAGMCDWALGTDTGGSVRIPAALCGVVGVKPTQGLLDTTGVAPLAPSLDSVGVLAPDVTSAARALEIVSGRSGLAPGRVPFHGAVRFAIPAGWIGELDAAVAQAWGRVARDVRAVPFPGRVDLARVAMTIFLSEAAVVHGATLSEHPEAFGPDVRAALLRGLGIAAVDYLGAIEARRAALQMVELAMDRFDVLILPTVGRTAPRRGEAVRERDLTRYTLPFNLTGQPSVSLPIHVAGLPVGIQLVGRRNRDDELLAVAFAVEQSLRVDQPFVSS